MLRATVDWCSRRNGSKKKRATADGKAGANQMEALFADNEKDGEKDGEKVVSHQVLCITHLPQLAAFGDQHFTVNKRVITDQGEERTSTVVNQLDEAQRVEELMQMLGANSEAGRRSVEEMVSEVKQVKRGKVQAA